MKSLLDFLFRISLLFALCTQALYGQYNLSDYKPCAGPFNVEAIPFNLSGITYNSSNGFYYGVTNTPANIYEIDSMGGFMRMIALEGFSDVEDLCHVKDDAFAIVEERLGRVHLIEISLSTFQIFYPTSNNYIQLTGIWMDNTGIEGISFDSISNVMYLVEEKSNMTVYSIDDPFSLLGTLVNANIPFDLENSLAEIGDTLISDMSGILAMDSCLFLLSDEGKKIIQLDAETGEQKDALFDLSLMNQPEGICLGNGGNIYIVGEANEMMKLCLDSMVLDTMMIDTMGMDTMMIDTMGMDTMMVDTMGMDTMNMDTTTLVFQMKWYRPKVYPNPSSDYLFVEDLFCDEAFVEIYDIKGIRIHNQYIDEQGISVSHLEVGIYVIRMSCGSFNWNTKFVKSP